MLHVIDCSFSSALFLPDENSGMVRDFFLQLKKHDSIHVPHLWWYETINVLNVSIKRKRLNHATAIDIFNLIGQMSIETDSECGIDHSRQLFELTQIYAISSYDAAFLELAMRKKARLMSLDEDLMLAAEKIGIG